MPPSFLPHSFLALAFAACNHSLALTACGLPLPNNRPRFQLEPGYQVSRPGANISTYPRKITQDSKSTKLIDKMERASSFRIFESLASQVGLFRHSSLWRAPECLLGNPVTEATEALAPSLSFPPSPPPSLPPPPPSPLSSLLLFLSHTSLSPSRSFSLHVRPLSLSLFLFLFSSLFPSSPKCSGH
jgi:hypothetical protein